MNTLDFTKLNHEQIIMFNQAAEEIRVPFNDLTEQMSAGHADNLDWIASSLASRSMYVSPLFLNCCRLALVKELLERGDIPERIIVDSPGMMKLLKAYFSQNGYSIEVRCPWSRSRLLSWRGLVIIRWLWIFVRLIREYVLFNLGPKPRYQFDGAISLLDTFVLETYFQDGAFRDRYYPGLPDFLEEDEKAQFYFLPTFLQIKSVIRISRQLGNSQPGFIVKEHFLKMQDYYYALGHPRRLRRLQFAPLQFYGFGLDQLLREELRVHACNGMSVLALLNYRFVKRLQARGIKVRLLVDWFENQLLDRGLNIGFKHYYPDTWIVGYQGFVVPPLLFMRPTGLELNSGVLPHEIGVVGPGLVQNIREFCTELKVCVAPAFRFQYLWRERTHFPPDKPYTILVALPIGVDTGNEILHLLKGAAGHGALADCRINIKAHPTNPPARIKAVFGPDWPAAWEFVEGDFNSWVEQSHLVISNASSICLETLARGIPLIVVGSQSGLSFNPIPPGISGDIWELCYTAQSIERAIHNYRNRDQDTIEKHYALGEEIKQTYFEPVTRENVRRFLKLAV